MKALVINAHPPKKPHHITDAAKAMTLTLSADEIAELERLAAETGVDTKGAWEEPMV